MKQTPETIKIAIGELREFVDADDSDLLETRIAYESEQLLRWVLEDTVDWPDPLQSAKDTARIIRRDSA